jgi:hypothetical protein
MERLVINDSMTATGYIHYTLDKKQIYRWLLGRSRVWWNKHWIYFVQYQKNNLSIALWDLFNTTGIETPRVLIITNELLHILWFRTSCFQETSIQLKRTYYSIAVLMIIELNNGNDYNKHSTYVESELSIMEQK